jgi:hypothetical protein
LTSAYIFASSCRHYIGKADFRFTDGRESRPGTASGPHVSPVFSSLRELQSEGLLRLFLENLAGGKKVVPELAWQLSHSQNKN